ncbi:MAG: photosystem II stability/assembly factor-like uncharacterized protein [Crocinitomix sp.]
MLIECPKCSLNSRTAQGTLKIDNGSLKIADCTIIGIIYTLRYDQTYHNFGRSLNYLISKTLNMKFSLLILCFSLLLSEANAQWTIKPSGTTENLQEINFPNLSTGYCVGDNGTILKTTNIGETWVSLESATSQTLEGVYFTSALNGFVVGDNIMLHTIDGGENWTEVDLPISEYLMHIEFISADIGFCSGWNGALLKTIDGGATWVVKDSDCTRNLVNIQFPTPMVGYAVSRGYSWNFIKTTDGGETWVNDSIVPITNLSNLEAVYFTSEDVGVIGGWYIGAMVKTTDGGDSWADVAPVVDANFISIDFPSTLVGYAMGYGGSVYSSIDEGDTWVLDTEIESFSPNSMEFITNNTGFSVGYGGDIYKISDESASIESSDLNQDILIYPNPIADELTLQVPEAAIGGTFTIYNLMGEEMRTIQVIGVSMLIDCAELKSGHYIGRYSTDDVLITRPFVKG